MRYKSFKKGNIRIAFDKFPKTAKQVSEVYKTGIRNWNADDSKNYSIVLGTFRIILSFEKNIEECAG